MKGSVVDLPDTWNAAMRVAAREAAANLEIPPSRIQARLYKLLIYQKGGFFLPHRDS